MRRLIFLCLLGLGVWPLLAPANQLSDIYKLAQDKDAQFAAAQAALRAGKEAYPQALASALPSLSANAQVTNTKRKVVATPFSSSGSSSSGAPSAPFTDTFTSNSYGVQLRQPIFDWGLPAQLRQGRERVKIAQLDFSAARQHLLSRVIKRYLGFLSAAEELQYARAQERALKQDLNRAKGRYDVGETAVTGLREAQAASDLAVTNVIDAQTALDQAREALKEVTTRWYARLPGLKGEIPMVPPDPHSAQKWVHIAMSYNANYLSAARQAKIAEDDISRKRAGHIPDLSLVAGYTSSDDTEYVLGGESNDTSIGLQATWQLFSGGRTFSEVREARAKYDQAQADLVSTRRQVSSAVRNAYRQVVQGISRVQALQQAIKSARASLKATKAGFQVGERTQADVLDARQQLYRAYTNHASARYQYLENVVALKLNAGILTPEDLQHLDARLAGARIPRKHATKLQE